MKLQEISVRLRVHTTSSRASFAIPVRLTGAYDTAHCGKVLGVRLYHVEIVIEDPARDYRVTAWVPIGDLENAWRTARLPIAAPRDPDPLDQRDARRRPAGARARPHPVRKGVRT